MPEKNLFRIIVLLTLAFFATETFAQTPPEKTLLPGQIPRVTRSGGTIYRCLFDAASDALDSDGWPDYWSRKTGGDRDILFPDYLEVTIAENDNPFSNNVLRMNIRGGGAAVFSPKIPVRPGMSYGVSVYFAAEDLVHSDVFILVSFYGPDGAAPLRSVMSETQRNTRGWRQIAVGPLVADMPDVRSVSAGLLVLPTNRRNDFDATVEFTNLEIRESPTIALTVSGENHLYFSPRDVSVDCRITGIDPSQHAVDFVLEDPFGRVIATKKSDVLIGNRPAAQFIVSDDDFESVYVGVATWEKLPIISPGFYRVRVATPESFVRALKLPPGVFYEDPFEHTAPLTFAVLPAQGAFLPDGEFGWNLDGWTHDEVFKRLKLLRQSGISRLKLPAWFPGDAKAEDRKRFNDLCDLLARQQVHLVGLLSPVPDSVRKQIRFGQTNALSVFSLEPDAWNTSLQPTLQDLSLLVKDWQWTADDDLSLSTMPGFVPVFNRLRNAFDKNNYGLGIGLAWDWNQELPPRFEEEPSETAASPSPIRPGEASREFVALTSTDVLTPEELEAFLTGSDETAIRRFVTLTPLPRSDYELTERVNDLVRRMVTAKAAGVEAVFLTKPVDDRIGVLNNDITPGELFLPWRTTSTLLSGRRFLGSVALPNGSRNFNFDLGDGQAVMVLWNDRASLDRPVEETLYLGRSVDAMDVWGNRFTPELRGREQVIPVGPIPLFLTGLNADIVRLRSSFRFDVAKIPSVPNRENKIPFSFRNDLSTPISARLTARGPRPGDWTFTPETQSLPAGPGSTVSDEFSVTLSNAANYGRQPIRVRMQIDGAEKLEFDVYGEIFIGDPDVFMEFSSRMTPEGDIEVTQAFINNGDRAHSYSCRLFVPQRPYLPSFVRGRGFGRWESVYMIPDGRALVESGVTEAVLRAAPVGGPASGAPPMVYTISLQNQESP